MTYNEGQLWYILESLLSAVYFLKNQNVNHSDIRPYNVLVTPEGQLKLGEIFSQSQSISAYSQLLVNSLDEIYLSPQLFDALKEYKASPAHDANKSDIYSIGMTVLEAATLEEVSHQCYDKENFKIRTEQVNGLLNKVQTQHSLLLSSFLRKILTEDETTRPSIEDLVLQMNKKMTLTQKTNFIVTVENAQTNDVQQEKVFRSSNLAGQSCILQNEQQLPATENQNTSYIPANYQDDDLNARIQAVLDLSRETIAKYGTPSLNYENTTPLTYTTTTYTTNVVPTTTYTTSRNTPIEISQTQANTFNNENGNNIEIQYNLNQELSEDVVKKSQKEDSNVPAVQTSITNYELASNNFNINPSTLAQYNFISTPEVNNFSFSSYVPYQKVQETSYTSSLPASSVNTQQFNQYTTVPQINFNNPEEREAYINKIRVEAKNYAPFANTNTTTTYTTYVNENLQQNATSQFPQYIQY